MRLARRGTTVLAAAATAASLAPLLAVPPASAHAVDPVQLSTVRAGKQQVTLVLTPPDRAGLHRLAASHTISRAARVQALQQLVPTPSARQRVVAGLRSLGLHVTAVSRWSVTATGPSWLVEAEFGSARSVAPHARVAQALPHLPAQFAGLVTAAFGGDDTRPAALPLASHVVAPRVQTYATAGYHGDQLRAAYGLSGAPVVSGGQPAPTVATVQLSGWNAGTLSSYAAAAGLPDPVRTGQYTAVDVDGGDASQPDGYGGDQEVALDQETLLAVAPEARQRVYFTDNSEAGFADAIFAVGDDATDGTHDGYRLTALSISWGDCEQDWSPPAVRAMDDALNYVVAAGVTTFVASGDDGAYGCYDSSGGWDRAAAVDFPAGDPVTVAVGGTTLNTDGTETGWVGSGGGTSSIFAEPAYQSAAGIAGSGREVPDIAVDGDPDTGFGVLVPDSQGHPVWATAGGTSLSSPLAAGLLTGALANAGYTYGVGDIHAPLYGALGSTKLRDITAGTNTGLDMHGQPIGTGLSAAAGYDQVTGLGAPQWDQLASDVLASAAPHVRAPLYSRSRTVPVTLTAPQQASYTWAVVDGSDTRSCAQIPTSATPPAAYTAPSDGWRVVTAVAKDAAGACHLGVTLVLVDERAPVAHVSALPISGGTVRFSWGGSDPGTTDAPGSGVARYAVRIYRNGVLVFSRPSTTATSYPMTVTRGATYAVYANAIDAAGNVSPAVSATFTDDASFGFSSGWTRSSAGSDVAGTAMTTAVRGRTAFRRIAGTTYDLVLTTSPWGGEAAVYVDGRLVRTIDTYASTVHYRVLFGLGHYAWGGHTVKVVVLGTHRSGARGSSVFVDGLAAY